MKKRLLTAAVALPILLYAVWSSQPYLFFAIAAGAALQVVVEVGRYVARTAPGGLRSGWAMGGYLAGIAAMWATGFLAG